MQVVVFLVLNNETIEVLKTFKHLSSAKDALIDWAEYNNISLDPDDSEASIYFAEDDEENEEYVSSIIHNDCGTAQIIITQVED